jgi:hypothetical protein
MFVSNQINSHNLLQKFNHPLTYKIYSFDMIKATDTFPDYS